MHHYSTFLCEFLQMTAQIIFSAKISNKQAIIISALAGYMPVLFFALRAVFGRIQTNGRRHTFKTTWQRINYFGSVSYFLHHFNFSHNGRISSSLATIRFCSASGGSGTTIFSKDCPVKCLIVVPVNKLTKMPLLEYMQKT